MSTQMWLPLVSMLVMRSVDTNDPFNQQIMLAAFIFTHALILIVAAKIRLSISSKGDKTPISVPIPKPPFGEDANKPQEYENTYVEAYDAAQLNDLVLKKIGMSVIILVFIYWKWQIVIPFAFQSVMNPVQVYQHQLFKIFILGQEDMGDLKRPWPVPDQTPAWLKGLTGGADADEGKKGGNKKKQ